MLGSRPWVLSNDSSGGEELSKDEASMSERSAREAFANSSSGSLGRGKGGIGLALSSMIGEFEDEVDSDEC